MDNQNNQNYPQEQGFNVQQSFFSKNKFIIIAIVVLAVISFSITGYLLMTNKKPALQSTDIPVENVIPISSPALLSNEQTANISQPATPTPTPTISLANETVSWSAFVSSKYSYSIKYPPNWNAQITAQSDPKILEYVVFNPTATKAGTLSITLSYGNRTYAESLTLDPQKGEALLVASVAATKKSSKDSNGYKATNVIVPYGLNTIIFNAKDAYINLFNQMLTTLKLSK